MRMRFDRVVSDELIRLLTETPARQLVDLARTQDGGPPMYDLQLRRSQPQPGKVETTSTRRCWATLYYGLTKLIDLVERDGQVRASGGSYEDVGTFDPAWSTWRSASELVADWPRIAKYLDDITTSGRIPASQLSKEGPVHAAISSGNSDAFRVINREANPAFASQQVKDDALAAWVAPFNAALAARAGDASWWPQNVKVGASVDHIAVDIAGRLLIIEAKAGNASAREIAKVAAQAGVYAAMYADMIDEDPTTIRTLRTMLQQRVDLKLAPAGRLHLREHGRVAPIVALGWPAPSTEVQRRMWEVTGALDEARDPEKVDPLEVWFLDHVGRIARVERAEDVVSS